MNTAVLDHLKRQLTEQPDRVIRSVCANNPEGVANFLSLNGIINGPVELTEEALEAVAVNAYEQYQDPQGFLQAMLQSVPIRKDRPIQTF